MRKKLLAPMAFAFLLSSCLSSSVYSESYRSTQIALTKREMSAARNAVIAGMTADEVHSALEDLAWGRYDCGSDQIGPYDVFMVGSHDSKYSGNLALEYIASNGDFVLHQIATWENYQLELEVTHCSPLIHLD